MELAEPFYYNNQDIFFDIVDGYAIHATDLFMHEFFLIVSAN